MITMIVMIIMMKSNYSGRAVGLLPLRGLSCLARGVCSSPKREEPREKNKERRTKREGLREKSQERRAKREELREKTEREELREKTLRERRVLLS